MHLGMNDQELPENEIFSEDVNRVGKVENTRTPRTGVMTVRNTSALHVPDITDQ